MFHSKEIGKTTFWGTSQNEILFVLLVCSKTLFYGPENFG